MTSFEELARKTPSHLAARLHWIGVCCNASEWALMAITFVLWLAKMSFASDSMTPNSLLRSPESAFRCENTCAVLQLLRKLRLVLTFMHSFLKVQERKSLHVVAQTWMEWWVLVIWGCDYSALALAKSAFSATQSVQNACLGSGRACFPVHAIKTLHNQARLFWRVFILLLQLQIIPFGRPLAFYMHLLNGRRWFTQTTLIKSNQGANLPQRCHRITPL